MCLVKGTQNNYFSDGVSKWTFKSELGSQMHNSQPQIHAMGVVDGFVYHLDNGDEHLFRYPISILVRNQAQVSLVGNLSLPLPNGRWFEYLRVRCYRIVSLREKVELEPLDKNSVESRAVISGDTSRRRYQCPDEIFNLSISTARSVIRDEEKSSLKYTTKELITGTSQYQ